MNHPILLLSLLIGIGISTHAQQPFNFEIQGKFRGLGDDTLYLTMQDGAGGNTRYVIPVKADSFHFSGKANRVDMGYLSLPRQRRIGDISLFIEKGVIQVSADVTDAGKTMIGGTKANEDQNRLRKMEQPIYDQITIQRNNLKGRTDNESETYRGIVRQMDSLQKTVMLLREKWAQENPNSYASAACLWVLSDRIPFEQLDRLYGTLSTDVRNTALMQRLGIKVEGKRRSRVGKPAAGFNIPDPEGKMIRLSDFRGRYVLLDFWASWCVPCRQENPGLKALYAQYKHKGLEIIGISIDENGDRWKKAIQEDSLPWIHISDLKRESSLAGLFGVTPIPDNFLIDPNGIIIAKGLHGKELEIILAELLTTGSGATHAQQSSVQQGEKIKF